MSVGVSQFSLRKLRKCVKFGAPLDAVEFLWFFKRRNADCWDCSAARGQHPLLGGSPFFSDSKPSSHRSDSEKIDSRKAVKPICGRGDALILWLPPRE